MKVKALSFVGEFFLYLIVMLIVVQINEHGFRLDAWALTPRLLVLWSIWAAFMTLFNRWMNRRRAAA